MHTRNFRNEIALTMFAFFAAGSQNVHLLSEIQQRKGIQLNDFVLNLLPPTDFSIPIFFITYGSVLLTLLVLSATPDKIAKGLQMYALVTFLRSITLYLVPLEPPADMIFLNDYFANWILHQPNMVVTKDLFFSGHTATVALMFFLAEKRWHKIICCAAFILAPSMILWQHVHYTIDVVVAVPVAYLCYRLVNWLHVQRNTNWQTANLFR